MPTSGNSIKELTLNIAASLAIQPATEDELLKREFLKNISPEGVQRIILSLERHALFYKGKTMHINKHWAKKHLKEYDLF